jgi:hypothetical protein
MYNSVLLQGQRGCGMSCATSIHLISKSNNAFWHAQCCAHAKHTERSIPQCHASHILLPQSQMCCPAATLASLRFLGRDESRQHVMLRQCSLRCIVPFNADKICSMLQ